MAKTPTRPDETLRRFLRRGAGLANKSREALTHDALKQRMLAAETRTREMEQRTRAAETRMREAEQRAVAGEARVREAQERALAAEALIAGRR